MLNAKLVVVGGDAKKAEVRLSLPTVIGRGKEAGLTVPHALVSRRHTEIFERDGRLFARDLGSLNGTFINNNRIEGEQLLEPNQLLTLGNITFRAVYETVESAESGSATPTVADNETVTFDEVDTTSINATPGAIDVKDSQHSPVSSISNLIAFDETVPVDSILENAKSEPQADPGLTDEPEAKGTNDGEVVASENQAESSSDTNKSFVNPESENGNPAGESAINSSIFVADSAEDAASQSVSISALGELPTDQPGVSFVGNFDLGDDVRQSVAQVEPVEIDLGEEKESKDVEDSTLGSFLKKLPR